MKYTFLYIFLPFFSTLQAQTAKEIVQKADEKMRGSTMQAEMVIKTIRPHLDPGDAMPHMDEGE